MNTNEIADLFALVESTLDKIKSEGTPEEEKKMLAWKILSSITQVYGHVNAVNSRAPGQQLVARLIKEESKRLIDEAVNSIPEVPEEFKMMLESITGKEDDNEEDQ